MIAIVDYGAGNIRSVQNALDAIGARYTMAREAAGIANAAKIILPGVGHFGQMMRALDAMRLRAVLVDRMRAGVPFLGICLGMQALFASSQEAPELAGFDMLEGQVKRFPENAKVPHMGWNQVAPRPGSRLFQGAGERAYFYFAHSYYAPIVPGTAAECEYQVPYSAAIECGTLWGVQFHPEKSGPLGLRIVQNFVDLEC